MSELYYPLHLHTTYSVGDALPLPSDWAIALKEKGFSGGGIADHGTLSGVWRFQKELLNQGLKPLLGIEVYVVDEYLKTKDRGHLTIYFKDEKGFRSFLRYNYKANFQGFYYKPRFLLDDIFNLENVVILSGCIYSPILNDEELVRRFIERFGNDFYLELSLEPSEQRQKLNSFLVEMKKKYNVKFCFTLDAHYIKEEDVKVRKVLRLISLGKKITEAKEKENKFIRLLDEKDVKLLIEKVYPYLKDYINEAFENTFEIKEKCNFELKKFDFSELLPKHSFEEFVKLFEGKDLINEERFKRELEVYKKRGFYNYLMSILDIVEIAKRKDIFINPRGSVCSSLIAHILDIVPFNPMDFGLLFERFLTEEREDPPDIDLDIEHRRRDDLMSELKQKYKVAGVSVFHTFKEKQALRDVCRVLEIEGTNFKELPEYVLKIVDGLVGRVRCRGKHGVGFLLFSRDLDIESLIPLERVSDEMVCSFDAMDLSEIGIAKMDLIPLTNLTIIKEVIRKLGKKVKNPLKDVLKYLDRSEVYEYIYKDRRVAGIHMVDSKSARELLKEIKVNNFDELINFIAFDRPGPLKNYLNDYRFYIQEGKSIRNYPEWILKYLNSTGGLFLFQEQIMLVLKELGYSDKEIHKIRKAIGKKVREDLVKYEKDFIKRVLSKGVSKEQAERIWNDILEFSGYAFNKAHATAYALVSYLMAVLKYRYKEVFYEVLLKNLLDVGQYEEKIGNIIDEIKSEGFKVLKPSIEEPVSYCKYNEKKKAYRLGIAFIKGVGEKFSEKLGDGVVIKNFSEFVRKLRPSQVVLKSLILAGFFDKEYPRKFLYEHLEELRRGLELFIEDKIEDWSEEVKLEKAKSVLEFIDKLDSL